jgi:glycine cleavage system H protein
MKNKTNELSRRQFLKSAGTLAGGTALVSLAFGTGCKSSGTSTTSLSPEVTTSTPVDTTTQVTSPTTSAVMSTTTSNTPTSSSPVTTSSTPATATYHYVPPTGIPPLLKVGETACNVANDGRKYTADHVWVISLPNGVAVLGITETLVEMIAFPNKISMSKVGDVLVNDGNSSFANVEGSKLNVDILNPISGKIIEVNDFLLTFNTRTELEPLMVSPWTDGWMVAVQTSKPDELKNLLSATQYRDLLLKK